jgi:hypothetical protein
VTLLGAGSAAACHHIVESYAWSIVNGTSSGISGANTNTAVVVAPASAPFLVRLTVTDDAGRQDTADVSVNPNAVTTRAVATAGTKACPGAIAIASPVSVSVSPTSASLQAGAGTQAFSATVTDTTETAVTWQVNNVTGGNASVGTISTAGIYTPPATLTATLTVTVTATSVAVATQKGSAQVMLTTTQSSVAAGGGGGGGVIDVLTLLASLFVIARRVPLLSSILCYFLRDTQPFFLRAPVVRRRDTRLL